MQKQYQQKGPEQITNCQHTVVRNHTVCQQFYISIHVLCWSFVVKLIIIADTKLIIRHI